MSFVLNNAMTRKSDFLLERLRACMVLDTMARARDRFPRHPEDRYWVLVRTTDGDGEELGRALPQAASARRPFFHWQSYAASPWLSREGKNLAHEALKAAVARRPHLGSGGAAAQPRAA